ncbi:hypothetical protein KCP78_07420 [Salmonella enterica subsp. enterica]|nr:hypothetical protein KCP78_07420 [Salmonella enterica subsp. enterica]
MAIVSSRSHPHGKNGESAERKGNRTVPDAFCGKEVRGKMTACPSLPGCPLLKDAIPCRAAMAFNIFKEGDWAVAEMRRHRLKATVRFTPI